MPDLSFYFNQKYLIPSTRLKYWDYSSVGFYFAIICTYQKHCYFGEIVEEEMRLNHLGKIVYEEWLKTKEIRKNVDLDEFIIMPNHLHGIVIIKI
jgi:REP element-mobilizing transposase RayT